MISSTAESGTCAGCVIVSERLDGAQESAFNAGAEAHFTASLAGHR
jgi:hypothetical protein